MKRMLWLIVVIIAVPLYGQYESWRVNLLGRESGGFCRGAFCTEDYCYVGTGSRLRILDISDPVNPAEVGFVYLWSQINVTCVQGNFAYIANSKNGLCIVDVSDPTAPFEVGNFPG